MREVSWRAVGARLMTELCRACIWRLKQRFGGATPLFSGAGLSLVSVLVALAIVGVLLTIIMTMVGNMSVFLNRIEVREQGTSLAKEITMLWQESTLCQQSFSGIVFNANSTEANPQVVNMVNRTLNGSTLNSYQPTNPYRLSEVRLVNLAGPSRGRHFVRGSAVLEARGSQSAAPSLRPIEFPMAVEIVGGRISNCAVGQDTERRLTVVESALSQDRYNYPNWKLTAAYPNNLHKQTVTASCLAGFKVYECVAGLGQPGATDCTDLDGSIVLHDSDGGTFRRGPIENGYGKGGTEISERFLDISQPNEQQCQASVEGWFTEIDDPIYTYLINRPICVRAKCVLAN